jgi:hypothetical protein
VIPSCNESEDAARYACEFTRGKECGFGGRHLTAKLALWPHIAPQNANLPHLAPFGHDSFDASA